MQDEQILIGKKVTVIFDDGSPPGIGRKDSICIGSTDRNLILRNPLGIIEVIPWDRVIRISSERRGGV